MAISESYRQGCTRTWKVVEVQHNVAATNKGIACCARGSPNLPPVSMGSQRIAPRGTRGYEVLGSSIQAQSRLAQDKERWRSRRSGSRLLFPECHGAPTIWSSGQERKDT